MLLAASFVQKIQEVGPSFWKVRLMHIFQQIEWQKLLQSLSKGGTGIL